MMMMMMMIIMMINLCVPTRKKEKRKGKVNADLPQTFLVLLSLTRSLRYEKSAKKRVQIKRVGLNSSTFLNRWRGKYYSL